MKYEITKLGLGAIGLVLVAGFAGLGIATYQNTQEVAKLAQPQPAVVKTIIVTPTVMPTATPSAALRLPVKNGVVTLPAGLKK